MAFTVEYFAMCGREGGKQRAKVLSPTARQIIARKAANARWRGLNAKERKIEFAKGRSQKTREPWPRCPCGKYTIGVARSWKHKCAAPKLDNEPAQKEKRRKA